MSRKIRQFVECQAQVKVIEQTHSARSAYIWFIALAVYFAGVFYFWANFGGALAGG